MSLENLSYVHEYWLQFGPAPVWLHYAVGIAVLIMAVISVVGNAVVIAVYARFPKLNTLLRPYVLSLSISDLFSATSTYWMIIYSSFKAQFWQFGAMGCSIYGFIQGYCALQSITVAGVIALERAMALLQIGAPGLNLPRQRLLVALAWLYPIFTSGGPLLGWSRYTLDGILTTCCFEIIKRDWPSRSFIIYITVIGFLVPLGVISVSYCILGRIVLERKNKRQAIGAAPSRKDLKPLKIAFLVVAAFLVSWAPYSCMALAAQFGPRGVVGPNLITVAALFAKTCTATNPVIYLLCDSAFASCLKNLRAGERAMGTSVLDRSKPSVRENANKALL